MAPLDAAAEVCRMSGVTDLAAFLGQPPDTEPALLVAAFEARRRKLQGMLGNPKYRGLATFVIRHASALREVCRDLPAHLDDMAARAEARHLPAIEMMLRGLAATGPITPDREAMLRAGACSLGVRGASFDRLLREARGSAAPAIRRTAPRPRPRRAPAPAPGRPDRIRELAASGPDLDAAYGARLRREPDAAERQRLAIAYRVASHPGARARYEGSLEASYLGGPPGGPAPLQAPSRARMRVTVIGPRVRELPRGRPDEVAVLVSDGDASTASVTADVAWLLASPGALSLTDGYHRVLVHVRAEQLPWSARSGTVRIMVGDGGEVIEYRSPHFLYRMARGIAAAALGES